MSQSPELQAYLHARSFLTRALSLPVGHERHMPSSEAGYARILLTQCGYDYLPLRKRGRRVHLSEARPEQLAYALGLACARARDSILLFE
jgi:hypothetical protein